MTNKPGTWGRWPFALLFLVCIVLLIDQFLFRTTERTIYLDQATWKELHSTKPGYSRWRRAVPRAPRLSPYTSSTWYTAHLGNGRWFQLDNHDNGVLQHGDSVRVELTPFTRRVLCFQRLGRGPSRERVTVDACEDLVPFPVLIAALCCWILLARPGSDTALYLRWTIIVVGLVFLLALFAVTWPLMKATGWA